MKECKECGASIENQQDLCDDCKEKSNVESSEDSLDEQKIDNITDSLETEEIVEEYDVEAESSADENTDEVEGENDTDQLEEEPEDDEEISPSEPEEKKNRVPMILGVIGIVALLIIAGLLFTRGEKTSRNGQEDIGHSIMYMTSDEAMDTGNIGLYGDSFAGPIDIPLESLYVESGFVPIILSPDKEKVAYINTEGSIYLVDLTTVDNLSEVEEEYRIYENGFAVLDFSPESDILYFVGEMGELMAYNGETFTIDSDAIIPQPSQGEKAIFPMESGRVVYRGAPMDNMSIKTIVVGKEDEPTTIAEGALSLNAETDGNNVVYYTYEEIIIPADEADSDQPKDDRIVEIEPEDDVEYIFKTFNYNFTTGESEMISDDGAQIVWADDDNRFILLEGREDETMPQGVALDIYYYGDGKREVIANNADIAYYISDEHEYFVYQKTEGETATHYVTSFKNGLTEPVEIYSNPVTESVKYVTAKKNGDLILYAKNLEDDTAKLYRYEHKGDGEFKERQLVDEDVFELLSYQYNGQGIYAKNPSADNAIVDLYTVTKNGKGALLLSNVEVNSFSAILNRELDNPNVIVLTYEDREVGDDPVGTLVMYEDGVSKVIAEDFPANRQEIHASVYYYSDDRIYYLFHDSETSMGALYSFTGDSKKNVVVEENVLGLLV